MWIIVTIIIAIALTFLFAVIWLGQNMKWILQRIHGDKFFGLPLAERQALRLKIQGKARVIELLTMPKALLGIRSPVTSYDGVQVPSVCTEKSMQFAVDYRPESNDIFVATQMKCGTTWMQQIVHQILTRGEGEFSDGGNRHMYAISPWIESEGSVHLNDAPLVEDRRMIKTHLNTDQCPYSEEAKYIYVARHPAACLASSVDFIGTLMGHMAPQHGHYTDWFCSDDMWWGDWPSHVAGWWDWSLKKDNVLFVHFEAILDDPSASVKDIANFLGVTLTPEQLAEVVRKSSYQYMKDNEFYFEMSPPMPFDTGNKSLFVSGKRDRGNDVSEADRHRVLSFCREKLDGRAYASLGFYPDLLGDGSQ